jgi:hypothetical protein
VLKKASRFISKSHNRAITRRYGLAIEVSDLSIDARSHAMCFYVVTKLKQRRNTHRLVPVNSYTTRKELAGKQPAQHAKNFSVNSYATFLGGDH